MEKERKSKGQNNDVKIYSSDGKMSEEEAGLQNEDTFKYDLVEVTRELMQVNYKSYITISRCYLFHYLFRIHNASP